MFVMFAHNVPLTHHFRIPFWELVVVEDFKYISIKYQPVPAAIVHADELILGSTYPDSPLASPNHVDRCALLYAV